DISGFSLSFDYKIHGDWPLGDGFTFVIQNAGLNALGQGGGGLGYGASEIGGSGGINNSVAIKFDVFDSQGEATNSTGLYTTGAAPTSQNSINLGPDFQGFYMRSYLLTHVTMNYDGDVLTVTMTDSANNTVTQHYNINIPSTVGANTAWVGFTGSSGALE